MRKIASYGFLVVSLVLAFQAFQNSKLTEETETMGADVVCGMWACADRRPRAERSTIISHEYEFKTGSGPFVVTCRRSAILFGPWSCSDTLVRGRIGLDRQY